jgi:hypothetical protein
MGPIELLIFLVDDLKLNKYNASIQKLEGMIK